MNTSARLLYLQLFLAVALLSALLLAVGVGERVRAQRALRAMEQARLAQRIDGLAASAAERRRIARDVHDIVGHALNAVILQAGGARRMLAVDADQSRELIESVERTGRHAFHDLDAALGLVDAAPALDPGRSLADLPELVASLRGAGLTVDLTIDGDERPVPQLVDRSAFRIAQEALTNVVKHAGGARARVVVAYEPDVLQLVIADDGLPDARASNGGRGLIGMRERVSVLGGRIETGPEEGGGFVVRASLPLKQA
jgi:signal transduction histidine kinase